MRQLHEHAAALSAIGQPLIRGHYNLSERGWQNWRKNGVPKMHWKSLTLLAAVHGKPTPQFEQ